MDEVIRHKDGKASIMVYKNLAKKFEKGNVKLRELNENTV